MSNQVPHLAGFGAVTTATILAHETRSEWIVPNPEIAFDYTLTPLPTSNASPTPANSNA